MTKWEYKTIWLESNLACDLAELLNDSGEEGWELVHLYDKPMAMPASLFYCVFKRPIQEEDECAMRAGMALAIARGDLSSQAAL